MLLPDQATTQFSAVLLFFFAAIGFGMISLLLNQLAGGRFPNPGKLTTYECGNDPILDADIPFNFRFVVLAICFLIFEVEMVFFIPWAVAYQGLLATSGWPAFFEMLTFFLVLLVGLAYMWRRGGLEWE